MLRYILPISALIATPLEIRDLVGDMVFSERRDNIFEIEEEEDRDCDALRIMIDMVKDEDFIMCDLEEGLDCNC
jgi:hypothetical protein